MDVIQLKKALKVFKLDDSALEGYIQLYNKFHAKPKKIDSWKSLCTPDKGKLVPYSSLSVPDKESIEAPLVRLAVCKLNGGLGTSMNCRGSKSAIVVRDKRPLLIFLLSR